MRNFPCTLRTIHSLRDLQKVRCLFWETGFYILNNEDITKQVQVFLRFCFILILDKTAHNLTGENATADELDRACFVDLVTKMLKVDASERITPSQILQHPFITMSHIVGTFDNSFP